MNPALCFFSIILALILTCMCCRPKPNTPASLATESTVTISAEAISEMEKRIEDLEYKSVPAKGKSREAVESQFGIGKPTVNSKIPIKVPTDSSLREYEFCADGVLLVQYDSEWNVLWAHYINPYSTKGLSVEMTLTLEQRYRESKQRFEQMCRIREEYRKRFEKGEG
jgi:hypothetical protein